jgi:ferredoxin
MEERIKCRFKVARNKCIAVSACIVAEPDIYFLDDEAKAVIKKPLTFEEFVEITRNQDEYKDEWVTVETTERGFQRIVESAQTCPVLAIEVEKLENEEWVKVYPEF